MAFNANSLIASAGGCLHTLQTLPAMAALPDGFALSAALFVGGLVGGVMHCVPMCGAFVISRHGQLQKPSQAAMWPYHAGRISTYILLAVLFSTVLNLAFLFLPIRGFVVAPLLLLAGLVFLTSAFPALTRLFPWVVRLRAVPSFAVISRAYAALSNGQANKWPQGLRLYGLGMLLGFVPCGLVVSAIMAASTAPSPIQAGLAMAGFGLGTVPALVAATFCGQALQTKYPAAMRSIARGMLVWSALWLFMLAGSLLV